MLPLASLLAVLTLAFSPVDEPCSLDFVVPIPRHQIPLSSNFLFGTAVETEGHWLAVGIPFHEGVGAVAVFRRVPLGWALNSFLQPPGLALNEVFGQHIDLHGDVLAVGAHDSDLHGGDSGAVYVYRHVVGSGWVLEATPYQAGALDVGVDVSVHKDTLAVGARDRVDIYRHISGTWQHEDTIHAFDEDAFSFGDGVAVHEDILIVADDRYAGPGPSKAGRAYSFLRTGSSWNLAEIIPSASMTNSAIHFGEWVDIHGDWAIISAHLNDSATVQPGGQAHMYKLAADGTVIEHQALAPTPGQVSDQFSKGVAVRGNEVLVGAPGENSNEGAVYIYQLIGGTWVELHREPQPPGFFNSTAEFGTSVAIGDYYAVGAPRPGSLDRSGLVFVVDSPCDP